MNFNSELIHKNEIFVWNDNIARISFKWSKQYNYVKSWEENSALKFVSTPL